jgi:hypothetical protein
MPPPSSAGHGGEGRRTGGVLPSPAGRLRAPLNPTPSHGAWTRSTSLPGETLWWGVAVAGDGDGSWFNKCATAAISGVPLLFLPFLAGRGGEGRGKKSIGARGSGGWRGSSSISAFRRSANRSPLRCFVLLPWRKPAELLELESPLSNKRCCCSRGGSLSAPFNLVGRGGEKVERSSMAAAFRGRSLHSVELIIADAFIASVILCRQGGNSPASRIEASRHWRGCSNSLRGEVIHSPHWREGPRWLSVVGRGLPSSWPLLLGGDAARTPAMGGDDA